MEKNIEQIAKELAARFRPEQVLWVPLAKRGNLALVAPYLEIVSILDRLDEVLTPGGWQDSYELIGSGCVRCELRCRVACEWLSKSDVGAAPPSARRALLSRWLRGPDPQEVKAAFTDALKRTAMKWGIGRYLHAAPRIWTQWDAAEQRPVKPPDVPSWAVDGCCF